MADICTESLQNEGTKTVLSASVKPRLVTFVGRRSPNSLRIFCGPSSFATPGSTYNQLMTRSDEPPIEKSLSGSLVPSQLVGAQLDQGFFTPVDAPVEGEGVAPGREKSTVGASRAPGVVTLK